MRVKFEATDATGKVHKRSSMSHIYSHCVVIHFAAYAPSTLWPKGIAACSHAEWVTRWPSAKPAAGARNRVSRPSRSLRRGRCDVTPRRSRATSWQTGSQRADYLRPQMQRVARAPPSCIGQFGPALPAGWCRQCLRPARHCKLASRAPIHRRNFSSRQKGILSSRDHCRRLFTSHRRTVRLLPKTPQTLYHLTASRALKVLQPKSREMRTVMAVLGMTEAKRIHRTASRRNTSEPNCSMPTLRHERANPCNNLGVHRVGVRLKSLFFA